MTDITRIQQGMYWDRAWSLVEGCTPCSPGCAHCWSAEQTHMRAGQQKNAKIITRYGGLTNDAGHFTGAIRLMLESLDLPLRTRNPTTWAVWNDLFHEDVPFRFIDKAFAIAALCPHHTFLVLTKRAYRMLQYLTEERQEEEGITSGIVSDMASDRADRYQPTLWKALLGVKKYTSIRWPLPNVFLGVTCCDQKEAERNIPLLIRTPAAVRYVSYEPALGPINLTEPLYAVGHAGRPGVEVLDAREMWLPRLDWVIAGCESGRQRRPARIEWFYSLMQQCQNARVPFFLKQIDRSGKVVKAPKLGGQQWLQMPEVSR